MNERIKAIAFFSKAVENSYLALADGKFEDKELYNYITRAKKDIEENPLRAGIRIPERLIPIEYEKKYGVKALWKYDLPNAWRLLYTIVGDEVKIVSVILEWLSHKEYERGFKY